MFEVIKNAAINAAKQVVKFAGTKAGKGTLIGAGAVGVGLTVAKIFGKDDEDPKTEFEVVNEKPAEEAEAAEETEDEAKTETEE